MIRVGKEFRDPRARCVCYDSRVRVLENLKELRARVCGGGNCILSLFFLIFFLIEKPKSFVSFLTNTQHTCSIYIYIYRFGVIRAGEMRFIIIHIITHKHDI